MGTSLYLALNRLVVLSAIVIFGASLPAEAAQVVLKNESTKTVGYKFTYDGGVLGSGSLKSSSTYKITLGNLCFSNSGEWSSSCYVDLTLRGGRKNSKIFWTTFRIKERNRIEYRDGDGSIRNDVPGDKFLIFNDKSASGDRKKVLKIRDDN